MDVLQCFVPLCVPQSLKKKAPAGFLSRYRECEGDSQREQQVANMCVCMHVMAKRRDEEGESGTLSISLFISQGAP